MEAVGPSLIPIGRRTSGPRHHSSSSPDSANGGHFDLPPFSPPPSGSKSPLRNYPSSQLSMASPSWDGGPTSAGSGRSESRNSGGWSGRSSRGSRSTAFNSENAHTTRLSAREELRRSESREGGVGDVTGSDYRRSSVSYAADEEPGGADVVTKYVSRG